MTSSPDRIVRRVLADGTTKTYRYSRDRKARPSRIDPRSLDALMIAYKQSPEWRGLKPASKKLYGTYLQEFDAVGDTLAANVKRRQILRMRDVLSIKSGPGAANSFVSVAGALFSWAVNREWVEFSPATKIKPIKGGSLPAWTREEADRAVAVLPEPLARAVLLARHTGQRRGDLTRMTWAAWDGASIRLTQAKTGAPLVIPAHPILLAALGEWHAEPGRGLFILAQASGRPWRADHLAASLRAALTVHGFRSDISIHGLRKLAATELAEAGCSAHEIQAITGHSSLAMVEHYTRSVNQERLAGAAIIRLSGKR